MQGLGPAQGLGAGERTYILGSNGGPGAGWNSQGANLSGCSVLLSNMRTIVTLEDSLQYLMCVGPCPMPGMWGGPRFSATAVIWDSCLSGTPLLLLVRAPDCLWGDSSFPWSLCQGVGTCLRPCQPEYCLCLAIAVQRWPCGPAGQILGFLMAWLGKRPFLPLQWLAGRIPHHELLRGKYLSHRNKQS